jgi:hypothetical protein
MQKQKPRKRRKEKPETIIQEVGRIIIDGMNLYRKTKRLFDKRKRGQHDRVKTHNSRNKKQY